MLALPPGMPFTSQVTAVLLVLASVALRVALAPASTPSEAGHTSTSTAGATLEQALSPATAGAVVVANPGVTTTFAVSM